MRVTLISTDGPWLEAAISTPFGKLVVMDDFSIDERSAPGIGEEFEVELSASLLDEGEYDPFILLLKVWEARASHETGISCTIGSRRSNKPKRVVRKGCIMHGKKCSMVMMEKSACMTT